MPMGAASISLTWVMPSGTIERTCSGSFWPWMAAFRPGTRLSSTRVVLPEPGNPGHHSQPPLGNFDVQRLYGVDGVGGKLNAPQREQLALRGLGSQALRFARQERPNAGSSVCFNGRDAALGNHLAAARTACGPISISQSASDRIWVSWSTRMTELPSWIRSWHHAGQAGDVWRGAAQ